MFSEALPNPPTSKNLQFPIKPDSFSDPNLDRRMIWCKTSSQTYSQNHHGRANGFELSQSPIFILLPQCALQSWGAYFWVITVLILQNSKFSQDDNIIYVPLASFSASKGNPRILSSCLTLFLGWIKKYIYILILILIYIYYTMPRYVFIMQEFAVLRNKLRSMILLLRKSWRMRSGRDDPWGWCRWSSSQLFSSRWLDSKAWAAVHNRHSSALSL